MRAFAVTCEPLCSPGYGQLRYSDEADSEGSYPEGTKVYFGCAFGFYLRGSYSRRCSHSGSGMEMPQIAH